MRWLFSFSFFCYNNNGDLMKRDLRFDLLRTLSMSLVVIIHVANVYCNEYGSISNSSFLGGVVFNVLARVCVPIFFMISGALLATRKFDKKYWDRILKIIILIVVWDIFYLIWEYFYLGIKYDHFYRLLFEPFRNHLWFLYTLVVVYAFQPLLGIMINKQSKIINVIFICIWLFLCLLSIFIPSIASYFSIFCFIGYFYIGRILYDLFKDRNIDKITFPLVIITIGCLVLDIILSYNISVDKNMFYNVYFAYRNPLLVVASCSCFVLVFNYLPKILNKIWLSFSTLSLGIYLLHGVFLDISKEVFTYSSLNSFIGIPLFSMIILLLSILSVYLLKKIKILNNVI